MSRDLVPYDPDTLNEYVERQLRRININPAPYRPQGLSRLWTEDSTLEDDAEWYRQRGQGFRAQAGMLEAGIDLLRTVYKVGQLPVLFARDDQIRQEAHAFEMLKREVSRLALEELAAGHKRRIAEHEAVTHKRKQEMRGADDDEDLATPRAQHFRESLQNDGELRRVYEAELRKIDRSSLSKKQKDALRKELAERFDNHRIREE